MSTLEYDRRRRRPLARISAGATVLLLIYLSSLSFSAARSSSRVSRSNSALLDQLKAEQLRTNQEIQDQRDVAELRLRELESRNDTHRLAIVALERQVRMMGGHPLVGASDVPTAPPRGLDRGREQRDEANSSDTRPGPTPSPTTPSGPPSPTTPSPSAGACPLPVCPSANAPLAQRGTTASPVVSSLASEDMQVVSVAVGLVLPVVVALATRRLASSRFKAGVLAALATASAVLVEAQASGSFSYRAALLTGVTTFVTAVATHYGLLKPTGVTGSGGVVARGTSGVGLGRPVNSRSDGGAR